MKCYQSFQMFEKLALLWSASHAHSKALPSNCLNAMLHSMLPEVKFDNPLCMPNIVTFSRGIKRHAPIIGTPVYYIKPKHMRTVKSCLPSVWMQCCTACCPRSNSIILLTLWLSLHSQHDYEKALHRQMSHVLAKLSKFWNVWHVSKALKCLTC